MKILIVGAGIAGLSFAAHLKRYGITAEIIEKTPNWEQEGYVIGLSSLGLNTLKPFHIDHLLKKFGYVASGFDFRNIDGHMLKHVNCKDVVKKYGPEILIPRSDLHKILRDLISDVSITPGVTISSFVQKEKSVLVELSNGKKEEYDLVVGADGVHSKIRELLFHTDDIRYAHLTGWIYMASSIEHHPSLITEMWSDRRFFGVYPSREKKLCVIFAAKLTPQEETDENSVAVLREYFKDFGWIVPKVLSTMKSTDPIYKTRWKEVFIDKWYKGRVVLIGDAAHAMLPTFGMGGSMALEDSFVLAEELSYVTSSTIPTALVSYLQRRQKRVEAIRKHSDFVASLIHIHNSLAIKIMHFMVHFFPDRLIKYDIARVLSSKP